MRKPNDVKQVEPGTRSGHTAPDTGRDRDNGTEAAAARDISALRREMERRDQRAGPPPSFEVSQLEIEADIQQVIARVEAARAQAREAEALRLDAATEERLAAAEMARLADTKTARGAEAEVARPTEAEVARPAGAATGAAPGAAGATTTLDAHL